MISNISITIVPPIIQPNLLAAVGQDDVVQNRTAPRAGHLCEFELRPIAVSMDQELFCSRAANAVWAD
jgi:hypothetical protein